METLLHELVRGLWIIGNRNARKRESIVHLEKLVRLPGVAPGHSPWRGDILLLNHSRKESKRAGSVLTPGPRHFNKEQTPLGDLFRSQPAVSRRLFRCLGAHLLRSPLNVKSSADTLACFLATAGQNPSVENLGSPTPQTAWCLLASSRCRFTQCHSATPFFFGFTHSL